MTSITVRVNRTPTMFHRRWYWEAYDSNLEWYVLGYAMTKRRAVKLARNAGYLIKINDNWEEVWTV